MHRVEELLRDAHVAMLETTLTLRQIQSEAGLSAISAHQMFARFDEAQALISSSIAAVAGGHKLARAIAPIAGIDPQAYGEGTEPSAAVFGPIGHLTPAI